MDDTKASGKKRRKTEAEEKSRKRSPVRKKEHEQDPPLLTNYYGQPVQAASREFATSRHVPTMAERKVTPAMMTQLASSASSTTGSSHNLPVTTPLVVKTELSAGRIMATLPPKKSPSRMGAYTEEERPPGVAGKVSADEAGARPISPGLLAYVQQQQLELQRRQQQTERQQQNERQQQQDVRRVSPQPTHHYGRESEPGVRRTPPPSRQNPHVQHIRESGPRTVHIPPGHVVLRPTVPAGTDYGLLRQQLLQKIVPQPSSGIEAQNIFSAYKNRPEIEHMSTMSQGASQDKILMSQAEMHDRIRVAGTNVGEIRRITSFIDTQPPHSDRHSPGPPHQIHVSTIRRTPSPAHQKIDRVSPLPPSLSPNPRISPARERAMPVNLSVQDGHSTLYRPDTNVPATQQVMVARHIPRISHSETRTTAYPLPQQRQLSVETSPSSMMSFAEEQGEILRQTLMRPMESSGSLSRVTDSRVSPRSRSDHDMYAQSPSPKRQTNQSPSPNRRTAQSPSPSQGLNQSSSPGRKPNQSPSPVRRFATEQASPHQSPDQRQYSPVSTHSSTQRLSTQQGHLTTAETRHRTPSPKPQHRHKESMAGALARTFEQSSSVPSAPAIGQIRQPVVNLMRLPISESTDPKNLPSFSASAVSQMTSKATPQKAPPQTKSEVRVVPSTQRGVTVSSQQERVPFTQIQQQTNPFTFPSQPPSNVSKIDQHAFSEYGIKPVKQERGFVKKEPIDREKNSESPDDMPRLTPITTLKEENEENNVELVEMPVPFNRRLLNIANLPTSSIYRSTYRSHTFAVNRAKVGVITNTAKSLDILRQNLQKCINKEIDQIIQQYMEKFFKPGIENIKVNNGEGAVSDEHVQAVCRQILEEAKKMYSTDQVMTPGRDIPDNVSETGSTGSRRTNRKRRPSDTDSDKGPYAVPRPKKKGRPPFVQVSGRTTPSKTVKAGDLVKREGPKWDTERLKPESRFVMGARANKALGLGATRGRIYIKHPDVFKYSGDQDDKTWLYENSHMPATGGKAYMLLLEDIQDLAKDEEYRDNPNVFTENLTGFTIPDWMLEKAKIQMGALRTDHSKVKSRSATPVDPQPEEQQGADRMVDPDVKLPFTAFTSPKDKERSPSAETEIDFLTTEDNDNTSNMSPYTMTGGFDEGTSPSPSDVDPMEDDGGTPLSGHFEYTK